MRRTLLGALVLSFVGCAHHVATTTVMPPASAPPVVAQAAAPAPPVRPPHKPFPAWGDRKPELGLTAPLAGEPSVKQLTESRLAPSTCGQTVNDDIAGTVREMRREVDEAQRDWLMDAQECNHRRARIYRAMKAEDDYSIGSALSAATGSGGGRGEGIGLGSIGSPGHAAGAPPAAAKPAEPKAATKKSGTNNQVVGVDEADIVKTDGKWVYVVANGSLHIIEALNPKVASTTKIDGQPRDIFVEGDRAVVYASHGATGKQCTYAYDCEFAGDDSTTSIYVYDISERHTPKLKREFTLSGSFMTARRIGNAIHTVVADGDADEVPYETWPDDDLEMCVTPEWKVRAAFAKLKAKNEAAIRAAQRSGYPTLHENGNTTKLCDVYKAAIRDGHAFTTIASFDMTDDTTPPVTQTIESRPGAVFASDKALYLSVAHRQEENPDRWYSSYPKTKEVSDIHKFRIGASPKETKYVGSGSVPGHVLNQFAMDEWYGYLRIATSKGRVPDPGVSSAISILSETPSGALVRIGAVENIAPGEDIRSVRFDGDRGYIVTFKKTDPLFVADLFRPSKPEILGELKIPGFSTYMHRVDPNHLMSIGFDADDHGGFAYFNGIILQLFDVTNATDPKLMHKEKIGTRGSSSEAATNHLAFNWMPSEGLLALPMTICEGGGDGSYGRELAFSGLLVYDVDLDRGFTRLGGIDHGARGVSCDTWWSNANSAVKRSVFLDDLVYSIAEDRAKVQRLDHFGLDVANIAFER